MQKSLVVIYLNGGNDGLNVFVPIDATYAGYQTARPNIARVVGPTAGGTVGTMVMGGTGGTLGFANKLRLGTARTGDNGDPRWASTRSTATARGGAGSDLAIFPAADYNPPNRSHFESRDYWFGGAIAQVQTGWLGRWLDTYGSPSNPLQAVSLDNSLSKQIRTSTAPVCALAGPARRGFDLPGVDRRRRSAQVMQARRRAGRRRATTTSRARAACRASTVDVANRLATLTNTAAGAGYPPNSGLSSKLQMAAVLLGAGLGTRIVTIDWGSFDTHGEPARRAGSAAQGPVPLARRVQGRPRRRAASRDRDHDGVLRVRAARRLERLRRHRPRRGRHDAGLAARPSRAGSPASSRRSRRPRHDGDLIVKTDFRIVYQSLISEWLGGDPAAILPGGPFPGIQRYDGGTTLLKAA